MSDSEDRRAQEAIDIHGSEGPSLVQENVTTTNNWRKDASAPSCRRENRRRKSSTMFYAEADSNTHAPRPKRTIKPPIRYQ